MKKGIYTIKDELAEERFAAPMMLENDEVAERWFKNLLANTPVMKAEPKDFSLWKVGEFDTVTGDLFADDTKLIVRG